VGQMVKAQVLAVDPEKRQIKLSMKQLVPTGLGEYLEEHKEGDVVSGRVVDQSEDVVTVELGEGIRAACRVTASTVAAESATSSGAVDLSSLSSMLSARWKSGNPPAGAKPAALSVGQIRSFRIAMLDREAQKLELELG
jgi:small subunit ribosomal protein S1